METQFLCLVVAVGIISLIPPVLSYLGYKLEVMKSLKVYFIALSIGVMLGMVFLHLIPEAVAHNHGMELSTIGLIMLGSLLAVWLIEMLVHYRQHQKSKTANCPHTFTTMVLVGDVIHNFMDGLLLGASFLAGIPTGINAAIAMFAHEVPQELGAYATLLHGGYDRKKALKAKIWTALAIVPSAVLVFWIGGHFFHELEVILVPVTAGAFLYIALVDLLPQVLKKYQHNLRSIILCLIAVLIGVAIVMLLEHIGGHSHGGHHH